MRTEGSVNAPPRSGDDRTSLFDPRAVLFTFVSLAIWISTAHSIRMAVLWLVLACALVLASASPGTRRRVILRLLIWSIPPAVVVLGLYAVLAPSDDVVLWRLGPLTIGEEGLTTGLRLGVRFIAFVALARSLTLWLTPTGLAAGLTRVAGPLGSLGVRIGYLYNLLFFIARLTPALAEEAQIIQLGQRSRGLQQKRYSFRSIKGAVSLILPVFAAAARRSERLSLVLASRGYDPRRVPSSVTALRFRRVDWLLTAAVGLGWVVWALARWSPISRI
jgi:energy-coupling factor transport system permease protein